MSRSLKGQYELLEDEIKLARRDAQKSQDARNVFIKEHGLELLGLKVGDVIKERNVFRRARPNYSVTGAGLVWGNIRPTAVMIKKDGTLGVKEFPKYGPWEKVEDESE